MPISANGPAFAPDHPDLEIITLPLVNAKRREQFERIKAEVAPDLSVHLLDGMGRELVASDAALLASGTAALECTRRNARWWWDIA